MHAIVIYGYCMHATVLQGGSIVQPCVALWTNGEQAMEAHVGYMHVGDVYDMLVLVAANSQHLGNSVSSWVVNPLLFISDSLQIPNLFMLCVPYDLCPDSRVIHASTLCQEVDVLFGAGVWDGFIVEQSHPDVYVDNHQVSVGFSWVYMCV